MYRYIFAASSILLLAPFSGCQSNPAASQPAPLSAAPAASPFVGYWTTTETYGKPISTAASFRLDLTSDGQAVLTCAPRNNGGLYNDQTPPDEIRILHWQPNGPFARITDPHDPAFTLNARLEGDATLVISSPDFYIRMTRAQ